MTGVLMLVSNGVTHDPRVTAEADSLARAEYEVTVLGWDRQGTLPPEERRDGVRIVRVRSTPWMKLRVFDLFRLGPFWRLAARRAMELHRATPFAAIHSHDLDTLPAGVRLKDEAGLPLIYDAHEFFPDMVRDLSRARWWAPRFAALERRIAPRADLVFAAGPPHRDYLTTLTRARVEIVMNSRPLHYEAYEPPTTKRMKVVYIGGVQPFRFLVPLAELAVEDPSFDVDIAGPGPDVDRIRGLAAASSGNLRYLGVVPMADVLPRMRSADVVYCLLDPMKRILRLASPNKFFEALAAGRPILVSKGTWVAEEVEAAECGLSVVYTKEALGKALRTLQDDPDLRERLGRNALRLAKERYNWPREEATLLQAYRDLGVAPA